MSGSGDRTEKATPKKRQDARKQGQVAKSADLNTAVVFIVAVAVLAAMAPTMLDQLEDVVRGGLVQAGNPDHATAAGLGGPARWALEAMLAITAPIAAAALVAGVLANVAQVGLKATPAAMKPSLKKLNPLQGAKRIFGPNALVETAKTVAKCGVVGGVTFLAVWPKLHEFAALVGLPPAALLAQAAQTILSIAIRAAVAFFVIGALDYLWQRRKHEKTIKMAKHEVKQEARQADVSPEMRGALRRRQVEQARRRMLAEVPTADVVVTNPTHYAVALRYDGTMTAPQVVAKGADLVAQAIRRTAEEHGVPILSNPPLARGLFREVELGRMIPEDFFAAVAEVLAFVYRTAGRRRRGAA